VIKYPLLSRVFFHRRKKRMEQMTLLALDIFGTLVFAISGAFRAVKYELDLLGVLVLAIATGVGGGIMRDLILGETPPAVFQNEYYFFVCIIGALAVFLWAPDIAKGWDYVLIADAIGLGVFAAIGAYKAQQYGVGPVGIVMMAMLTAAGGGVIRDVLVSEIPAILHTDFYASAVLLGGLWFLLAGHWFASDLLVLYSTIALVISLRFASMYFGFALPRVKKLPQTPSAIARERRQKKSSES
jgi:uncharacterized membrane protein YeiH